ncbi:MAG: diaminopimelate decarboxylase [Spirochaetales bacterium]|nr:diaminopimelate decarboxylase [Spirochaetales bacterium]
MLRVEGDVLYIEDTSTVDLAREYGTPLYVYSENTIKEKIAEIRAAFTSKYPDTHAAYACKAFCTPYLCKLLEREGLWLDVVSGGELYTAIRAGFPGKRIEFNGNNKSRDELVMALEYGVGRIVVDNVAELATLDALCRELGVTADILFRITPGVMSDTHAYITTGKRDSKFGIPLDDNIMFPAIRRAIESDALRFLGFHFHVGSQLHAPDAHIAALEVALDLIKETRDRFGYVVSDFNMGGGFGIRYTNQDHPLPLSGFVDPVMERLAEFCAQHELKVPHVSMEPGRFIVGEAGIQLYTVGAIKEIPGIRTYTAVDGGMSDNIRPGLYGARYEAVIANRASEAKDHTVAVCGKCCESTDILIDSLPCPAPREGDILAVLSTGAYGYSMASNYNKLPVPAVVVVNGKESRLIVRRQSYEQMTINEIV